MRFPKAMRDLWSPSPGSAHQFTILFSERDPPESAHAIERLRARKPSSDEDRLNRSRNIELQLCAGANVATSCRASTGSRRSCVTAL
ncbi:MAG: hypothetical protein ACERJ2_05470 [Filomicrobium sp.]